MTPSMSQIKPRFFLRRSRFIANALSAPQVAGPAASGSIPWEAR
jgi:hypothetical protein